MTSTDDTTVFLIDDDDRMRAATQRLLKSVGLRATILCEDQWIRVDHLSGVA